MEARDTDANVLTRGSRHLLLVIPAKAGMNPAMDTGLRRYYTTRNAAIGVERTSDSRR